MESSAPFSSYSDALRAAVTARVKALLGGLPYDHERARALVKAVADAVLEDARALVSSRFKLIVNAAIVQTDADAGAGLVTHSAVFWDQSADGAVFCSVPSTHCTAVVTIYGAST